MANIPIAPKPPKKKKYDEPTSSGGQGSKPRSSASTKGSGGSGGSGGSDPYASYQRRQDAKEKQAKKKSSDRYLAQVDALQQQADAINTALGSRGFRRALNTGLANIDRVSRQQDAQLMADYNTRLGLLGDQAADNEKAADAQTYANLANRGRERLDAMSQAMSMGAGESDVLRAQLASLRNWSANQSEVNRSYHDSLRAVNSTLTDLNTDTRTARYNVAAEANADREQLWQDYYNRRSESLTQLGNVRGQQAEYLGMANEQVGSKKVRRRQKDKISGAGDAFERSAQNAGKAWTNPGVPDQIAKWSGAANFEAVLNTAQAPVGTATDLADRKPEGAKLRKW